MPVTLCSVEGCGRVAKSRGLCLMHYRRFSRHGHTDQTRPVTWGSIEKHPLYHVWGWIKRKSGKKHSPPICDDWRADFRAFVADIGDRPSEKHRLRLIDPLSPYSKDNVFWEEQKVLVSRGADYKEYARNYAREYRKTSPDNVKHTALKKMYGIHLDEYDRMYAAQNGVCKICGRPETSVIRGKLISLAVDHCHTTGKIRGLLCHHCNKALGGFKDDVTLLERAISYLKGDQA